MKKTCNGKPSASNYGNGCRCAKCREAWRIYSEEDRIAKRKPSGSRDKPIVYSDAYTREEIMRARA